MHAAQRWATVVQGAEISVLTGLHRLEPALPCFRVAIIHRAGILIVALYRLELAKACRRIT